MLSIVILSVSFLYCNDEFHYAQCCYAGCHYAEFSIYIYMLNVTVMPNVIILSVIKLNVMAPLF